jgi:hypothetical protein
VQAALWLVLSRRWQPRLGWITLVPALTLMAETGLYALATGDPWYRWRSMAAQQANPGNLLTIAASTSGGGFWTDPLLTIVASHEFSIIHTLAVPLAVVAVWRRPELRWVAVWLLAGFAWLYYGTTIPTGWVPVQRDARYAAALTIPAVLLIAAQLARWSRPRRTVAVAGLAALGLAGAALDLRDNALGPHQVLATTEFAADMSLEPLEYYGARWVQGLRSSVAFACASDAGRQSVVVLARALPGATISAINDRRYFVFSPERRPDLTGALLAAGWLPAAEITGEAPLTRRLFARLLGRVPTQAKRAARIAIPPRLTIFEHPAWPVKSRRAGPESRRGE